LSWLAAFYAMFWLGLAWHVLLVFRVTGESYSTGWYLYCVVAAEVILVAAGWLALTPERWRRWVLPWAAGLFCALEMYATHFVLVPYYTGVIAHGASGSLEAFHGGWATVLERLPATAAAVWPFYVVATRPCPS
jgi:hypothetical protein